MESYRHESKLSAALYLLSQKFFHGLSEFCSANLAVTISIELKMGNKHITKNKKYLLVLNENIALKKKTAFPYLFEGIPQLLHPYHVCCFSQKFGPHEFNKVFKVNMSSH